MGKNLSKKSKRQLLKEKQQRRQLASGLVWGLVSAGILAILGFLVWQVFRPGTGESVAIPADYQTHIEAGSPLDPYPSNPPAGGRHYPADFNAGFYNESDLTGLPPNPEGFLVHNLEHGYVIFWYNCTIITSDECTTLKNQIKQVMDEFNGIKLIAFPWETISEPVAMTSWGRLQRFNSFDPRAASAFIRANRNRAPEPNAP